MPLFGRSDEELAKREKEVTTKYTEIKELLQNQQNEIEARFQALGNLGASIMAKANLEEIYKQQLEALEQQKQNLAATVAGYQEAIQKISEKEQQLSAREQEVLRKEAEAQAAFAAQLDVQMQPLNQFKAELDAKTQRITLMQEEFNKNFVAQDQKLLDDFARLKAELQASFDSLQQQALQERERLAQRETALNDREAILAQHETEARQGFANERAQMLASVEAERQRFADEEQEFRAREESQQQRKQQLDAQENALAERIAAVQARESEADAQFARQRQEMLAQVQTERDSLLQQWNAALAEERQKCLDGLGADLQRQRDLLNADRQQCDALRADLDARERALAAREGQLQIAEEKNRQQAAFLDDKERLLDERFRKIAEERIAAAHAEAQAAQQARDDLAAKYASVSMQLEAMKLHDAAPQAPAPATPAAVAPAEPAPEPAAPAEPPSEG